MRVALTEAATGIGAEVAAKLVSASQEVTAFDINEPAIAVKEWIRTDLSDAVSIDAAIAAAVGPFDAPINSAGLPPRGGLAELILKVNYTGVIRFLDGMLDKLDEGAAIVTTASRASVAWRDNLDEVKALVALDPAKLGDFVASRNITPTRAYCLSKEVVIVMTFAATEQIIARGLHMNSLCPAAVSTGILRVFAAAFGERMVENVSRIGRPGLPGEVADVNVFLALPASARVKGQDLVVDGGMEALAMTEALGLLYVAAR